MATPSFAATATTTLAAVKDFSTGTHHTDAVTTIAASDASKVLEDLHSFLTARNSCSSSSSSSSDTNSNISNSSSLFDKSVMAVPVAAIRTLLGVVQRSQAETMMGLQNELSEASRIMTERYHQSSSSNSNNSNIRTSHSIALQSGIELFLKYITRTFLETPHFAECRQLVLQRGEHFSSMSLAARDRIAQTASDFILPNSIVLTCGWSRVVASILLQASQTKQFSLYILEGRPDAAGAKAAHCYATETNIPVTVVPDSAMAYILERVDMVLTGADAVVENGGVVNKLGTSALALCAHVLGKPFYVAAESYKFARLYPLHQSDLPNQSDCYSAPLSFVDTTTIGTPPQISTRNANGTEMTDGQQEQTRNNNNIAQPPLQRLILSDNVQVVNPSVDFTPAKFITLLFTDLGVLTPSAVSDELIRLYQ